MTLFYFCQFFQSYLSSSDLSGKNRQGFSYLDNFGVFYYFILILGRSTIKLGIQNPILNLHITLRSISQGCLSTSSLSNGATARNLDSERATILAKNSCLPWMIFTCYLQQATNANFNHPQSTHASVNTLLDGESLLYFTVS